MLYCKSRVCLFQITCLNDDQCSQHACCIQDESGSETQCSPLGKAGELCYDTRYLSQAFPLEEQDLPLACRCEAGLDCARFSDQPYGVCVSFSHHIRALESLRERRHFWTTCWHNQCYLFCEIDGELVFFLCVHLLLSFAVCRDCTYIGLWCTSINM